MDAVCAVIIVVVSLFRNADSAPQFVGPDGGSIFVDTGKSAKFSFKFTGAFDKIEFGVISSAGGFQTIVIRVTNGPPLAFNYNPEYLGRISWAGNENVSPVEAVFILSNVSQSDSKEYGCTAAQGAAAGSRIIDLIVTEHPVITQPSISSSYNEGTKVDVTCNATGIPTPTVIWLKEGSSKVHSTGEGSATLSFSSVSRSDAGQYRCKANNTAGTDKTGALSLVVHYPPSITKPSEPTVTQTVWENHNNELICTTDGVPVPRITWTKDGDSVTDNVVKSGNTSTLTLVLNAQNTVNDRYICSVKNIRGIDSATFNLVLGPPETKPTTPPPSGPDTGARGGSDISGALIGAIVAGVLGVIIIVVIIIYLLKCRKGNRSNQGPRPVGLKERGTKSVSDIDDYEPVRTQNELPQYASVDRSKKYQRKPDLNYAELDHGGAERSVDQRPINRRSEPTTYADIVQTWEPTDESTYANVPRGGHYSNDML